MADAKTKAKRARRRRPSAFIQVLNGLLMLFVLGIVVVGGLAWLAFNMFYAAGPTTEERVFNVARNSGLSEVADDLVEQGFISNRYVFQYNPAAMNKQTQLKAGEFRIAAGASMADILTELTEGRPIQYTVTIPEGFTSWQAVERLKASEYLVGDVSGIPAEGTILPDTYAFERNSERQDVLDQMVAAQSATLAEIWAGRDEGLPIESPQEMVILASIVEKETGIASERAEVAAVFVNRLRRGMRLQSDPTIIYGLTDGKGPLGHPLRRSELEQENAYNTYQIDGLPPGPIANPGEDALMAVAHPAETEALYFVAKSAVPSDGHLFANTYAEHQANVRAYRQAVREANAAAEARADEEAEAALEALQAEEAAAAGDEGDGEASSEGN